MTIELDFDGMQEYDDRTHIEDEQGCTDDYDDSMDGDFDSGMASAGFGTDEDYGCYDDCDSACEGYADAEY